MAKPQTPILYVWEGNNKQGTPVKGEISAENIVIAKAKLREQQITIKKIIKKSQPLFGGGKNKKIKISDICFFTRQLATMISAGIALVQALDIVGRGVESIGMKTTIQNIRGDVENGLAFSDALAKQKSVFGNLYINLVLAGEKSGSLDTMLVRLSDYLEKSASLRKKIKKAMTYPIIVISIATLITIGLLIGVVPKFATIFASFGADLPLPTRIVVGMSNFVKHYWWIILIIVLGSIIGFKIARKKSKKFSDNVEKFTLSVPILGSILRKAAIARFSRTLATTFAAGMPLVDALQTVAGAAGNIVYENAAFSMREEISTGEHMQQAMQNTGVFPSMVIQMVGIGEQAGSLDFMLAKVADIFEEEVDIAVDTLSTLMEPIIMVVLGVLIGGVVVAMYMPIFKLGSVM